MRAVGLESHPPAGDKTRSQRFDGIVAATWKARNDGDMGLSALKQESARARREFHSPPIRGDLDLSVVMMTKNESDNVASLVPRLWAVLRRLGLRAEIVVVDDSTDGTLEVARRLGCRVLRQGTPGYGAALAQGLAAAAGDYVATIDADYSHEPEFLYHMWAARSSADVVIGSRYVRAGSGEMPLVRRLLSRMLNWVSTVLLALPYKDVSSGFRLYHRRVLRAAGHLASRDFDAQEELLVRAYCEGWRIREVPIRYRPRHAGRSNARAVRFAISYLRTFRGLWALRNSEKSCDSDSRAFDSWVLPRRWWHRRRFRVITDLVRGEARSLDVGCGASQIIQALPAMTGLDVNLCKLRFLRRKDPGRALVCGSLVDLPFRPGAFATLVCCGVIGHVPKACRPIAEMNRVLEAGGKLVVGTPDDSSRVGRIIEWWFGRLPTADEEESVSHYTGEELRALLPSAGFAIRSEHTVACERIVHAEKVSDAWRERRMVSP